MSLLRPEYLLSAVNVLTESPNSFHVTQTEALLTREDLLSAVNGLTNGPQILPITQRDFFHLNCLHRDP